ncbi:MAG: SGNH/GDSL hydrolase family protein [Limisphaerales bacterium]
MATFLVWALAATFVQGAPFSTVQEERSYADPPTGDLVSNGVITPLDQEMRNFYIRNADGAIEVRLTKDAMIGLQTRVQRGGFETRKIEFSVGSKPFSYDLPQELYVMRRFKDAAGVKRFNDRQRAIHDGKLYAKQIADHLPTEDEPWISGRFIKENGRYMDVQIGDKVFQIGTQGHDGQHRIMGLLTHKDIRPFTQQAFVHGQLKGDVFHAREVGIRMLEDSKSQDDPKLGRYLFIGDSISGNYDKALRAALKGKLNIYHPPTNCGPVRKGVANIAQWLGAYDQPGLGWDIISFNFGQWDSGNTKAKYQADLETVIGELKKTNAKLIFVTTTPIPGGYPEPGKPGPDERSPGRVQETMKRFINPWALEVMARHPEIAICDQHALISNEEFYATWLRNAGFRHKSKRSPYGDLHLGGLLGQPVGRQLARRVLDLLGRKDEALGPHSLNVNDLNPDRQRPATKGMDVKDFVDLLTNDFRLRKYNR